jgi:hypothetical protein
MGYISMASITAEGNPAETTLVRRKYRATRLGLWPQATRFSSKKWEKVTFRKSTCKRLAT